MTVLSKLYNFNFEPKKCMHIIRGAPIHYENSRFACCKLCDQSRSTVGGNIFYICR